MLSKCRMYTMSSSENDLIESDRQRRRMASLSPQPSGCSWHLATYLVGWFLSACGIGLMVLSSDPVTTKGNWLVVLVAGISCATLGGALIVVAVSIPDKRSDWCNQNGKKRPNPITGAKVGICKKHEGVYIRFDAEKPNESANGRKNNNNGSSHHQTTVPIIRIEQAPPEVPFKSSIVTRETDFLYKTRSLDTHLAYPASDKYNGNIYVPPPTSWSSTLTRASYEDLDVNESTAIMFYRETPV